jgi:hypothetical protein
LKPRLRLRRQPPQVLYLDVETLIDEYANRLASREASTLAKLAARFPHFWNDNAMIT